MARNPLSSRERTTVLVLIAIVAALIAAAVLLRTHSRPHADSPSLKVDTVQIVVSGDTVITEKHKSNYKKKKEKKKKKKRGAGKTNKPSAPPRDHLAEPI